MIKKAQQWKIGIQSLLIVIFMLAALQWVGIVRINLSHYLENVLILLTWWGITAFVIYKIPYLKRHPAILYQLLALVLGVVALALADYYWETKDNPFSIPVTILFWVWICSLFAPAFFKKYRWYIIGFYGVATLYFLYLRLLTNDYSDQEYSRMITAFILPIPAIAALWIFEQWKWLQTLKAEKGAAELALLKSQINPHFFFNTLNNLYGLAVEKSDLAPQMILKLSDMMRYTIYEGKLDLVPLTEEVKYLENYIELHKIRYHKKVAIHFQKKVAHQHRIAPLLLVILLENAFKHGVEKLTEEAYIELELTTQSDQIFFQVKNNYEPEIQSTMGIGLANLEKRLQLIYPDCHTLKFTREQNTFTASITLDI